MASVAEADLAEQRTPDDREHSGRPEEASVMDRFQEEINRAGFSLADQRSLDSRSSSNRALTEFPSERSLLWCDEEKEVENNPHPGIRIGSGGDDPDPGIRIGNGGDDPDPGIRIGGRGDDPDPGIRIGGGGDDPDPGIRIGGRGDDPDPGIRIGGRGDDPDPGIRIGGRGDDPDPGIRIGGSQGRQRGRDLAPSELKLPGLRLREILRGGAL